MLLDNFADSTMGLGGSTSKIQKYVGLQSHGNKLDQVLYSLTFYTM